jgi:hypothetical protein
MYSNIYVAHTGLYFLDYAVRLDTQCRGDALASAHIYHWFVNITIDWDASADFFHHCPTSHVPDLINRLCTTYLAPITFIVEYYTHVL